jgi:transcriptional regulator with XRE-family HTH domain
MTLQQFLDQTNMSRAEFAKAIGVSEVAITRYIGGKRMPRPELLVKIVEATGGAVTPNDFLPEKASHPTRPNESAGVKTVPLALAETPGEALPLASAEFSGA